MELTEIKAYLDSIITWAHHRRVFLLAEEMIATSTEDCVNLALKLIDDAQYLQDIHNRLQQYD
jgi:hypothetical protein